jgi:hypothetical protein
MISFTFDDAPVSAATTGADVLEARGFRGTFYLSGGLIAREDDRHRYVSAEQVERLARVGHEIGCHTYSHRACGRASPREVRAEVERNAAALGRWGVPAPATFAFPFGDVSTSAKRALGSEFSLLRAVHHGVMEAGGDLNQAPAVPVYGTSGETAVRRWLEVAKARRAWLIVFTHDVAPLPSAFGCTPGALERLLVAALESDFDVVTVAEGARRMRPLRA